MSTAERGKRTELSLESNGPAKRRRKEESSGQPPIEEESKQKPANLRVAVKVVLKVDDNGEVATNLNVELVNPEDKLFAEIDKMETERTDYWKLLKRPQQAFGGGLNALKPETEAEAHRTERLQSFLGALDNAEGEAGEKDELKLDVGEGGPSLGEEGEQTPEKKPRPDMSRRISLEGFGGTPEPSVGEEGEKTPEQKPKPPIERRISLEGFGGTPTPSISEEKEPEEKKFDLKMVVYDFDCTISEVHIFHALKRRGGGFTSAGQLGVLKDLEDATMKAWFGGEERIKELRAHFKNLKDAGTRLRIISFGFNDVIFEALKKVKLDCYFPKEFIFGSDHIDLIAVKKRKAKLIEQWIAADKSLSSDCVMFVDDDQANTIEAEQIGACQTLHVTERQGMTTEEMGSFSPSKKVEELKLD